MNHYLGSNNLKLKAMSQPLLIINNISVSVENAPILRDITFSIEPGSVHWLLGPNGSGKSSLAMTIIGHPRYQVTQGAIIFAGNDITNADPHERSLVGIFIAFQNPVDIPGVSIYSLLKEALRTRMGSDFSFLEFDKKITESSRMLAIELPLLQRPLQGFSGGQKKKLELLQMLMLQPQLAILDEIDSGLDIDSCKIIGRAVQNNRKSNPAMSYLIISHNRQLANFIEPTNVHVMRKGAIIESGDATLFESIMERGFHECAAR